MVAFQINDQEREKLYGLPHLQQLIYFRGIRPYMDFATGMVGIKRKISYQSLREEVFVEPHTGYKAPSLSRDQVRRAVDGLIRADVIRSHSEGKTLILECLLATQDNSTQIKATTNPPGQGAIVPLTDPSVNKGYEVDANKKSTTPQDKQAATPPVSDNFNYSLSCSELVPKDYRPSTETVQLALKHGCEKVTCSDEVAKFVSYYIARSAKRADWDAEFINWLLRDKCYQKEKIKKGTSSNHHNRKTLSAVDRVIHANQQYLGRIIDAEVDN
jgi:hypothetical protein